MGQILGKEGGCKKVATLVIILMVWGLITMCLALREVDGVLSKGGVLGFRSDNDDSIDFPFGCFVYYWLIFLFAPILLLCLFFRDRARGRKRYFSRSR
jgi:hypothetical protein